MPARIPAAVAPPVTRSFTPVLQSVPGSPSSTVLDQDKSPTFVSASPAPTTASDLPAVTVSQIIEAAVADALTKQRAIFVKIMSEQTAQFDSTRGSGPWYDCSGNHG